MKTDVQRLSTQTRLEIETAVNSKMAYSVRRKDWVFVIKLMLNSPLFDSLWQSDTFLSAVGCGLRAFSTDGKLQLFLVLSRFLQNTRCIYGEAFHGK